MSAESTVAADQVVAGGVGLGKLNPISIGSYYAAFFALSIGYERMAKIAIQVDSRLSNGAFLPSQEMRSIGHKLSTLFDRVEAISLTRGYTAQANGRRPKEPIHVAIVDILTGFAMTGRYDHLDALGGPGWTADTAENQWDNDVVPILSARHLSLRVRRRIESTAAGFETSVAEAKAHGLGASFIHQDVDGTFRTGIGDITRRELIYEKLNPWGRMYSLQLGRWLANVLVELGREGVVTGDVPYLMDFFGSFLGDDELLRTRKDLSR